MSPLEPDEKPTMDEVGKVLREIQVGQHAMRRQLDKLEAEVDGVLGQIAEIRTVRDVEAGAAAARESAAAEWREAEAKNKEHQRKVAGATGTLLAAAVTAYLAWLGSAQYSLQRDVGQALAGIANITTTMEKTVMESREKCEEHDERWRLLERRLDRFEAAAQAAREHRR